MSRDTIRRYVFAFVVAAIAVGAFIGDGGILAVRKARRDALAMRSSIAQLKAENSALRTEAERLRTDPRAIESIARAELGLVRRGERLFILRSARPR